MIQASSKKKTLINRGFSSCSYILLDSKMNLTFLFIFKETKYQLFCITLQIICPLFLKFIHIDGVLIRNI